VLRFDIASFGCHQDAALFSRMIADSWSYLSDGRWLVLGAVGQDEFTFLDSAYKRQKEK